MTRFFIVLLAAGIAVLQWQLWAGRTSWDRLRELEAQLAAQKRLNAELRAGNETLAAELYSLENRRDAIEERARRQLSMIRENEVLFRLEAPGAAKGGLTREGMPDFRAPDIAAGAQPTFEPKKSDLYYAPRTSAPPRRATVASRSAAKAHPHRVP